MSEYCGDGEPCVVHVEPIIRARKAHTCCACDATIRPGDLYVRVTAIWDGNVQSWKRCGRCQKTHEHLRELCAGLDGYDEMYPREDLGCGLRYREEWGTEPPPEIQALPFLTADEASALLAARAKGGDRG